jgi:hypothetical protein
VSESIENDCWSAFSRAKDIQRAPADIDRSADLGITAAVTAFSDLFENGSRDEEYNNAHNGKLKNRPLVFRWRHRLSLDSGAAERFQRRE